MLFYSFGYYGGYKMIIEKYEKWLKMCANEPDLLEELLQIKHDKHAIEDRFYSELDFGTGGLRGVLGAGTNRLNIFTIRRAAAGLADYLLEQSSKNILVVIGYDSRKYSERFALESALMINTRGIKTYVFDTLKPVPMLSFTVREMEATAGIYITASHNPPEYNGFKVYGCDGVQITPGAAQQIMCKIDGLEYKQLKPMKKEKSLAEGLLEYIGEEIDDSYNEMLQSLIITPSAVKQFGNSLRLVYTPLHGSGNIPVRRALESMGMSDVIVVPSQEMPDSSFPTVEVPNPEDSAALALAIELAESVDAHIVLGTDPDCDRLGVAVRDNQGAFSLLTGNQIGCLMLNHILTQMRKQSTLRSNDAVITTIVSTKMAKAMCAEFGISFFEVLTGFKFIGEKIQEFDDLESHRFIFGFEESFGYLSGTRVRDKDAVNAAVLLAETACACLEEEITLFEKLERLYRCYGYYHESTLSKTFYGQEGKERIGNIMKKMRAWKPEQISQLNVVSVRDYLSGFEYSGRDVFLLELPKSDVLYFELDDDAWICARPSGTEPKIKLYAGAKDSKNMSNAIAKTQSILNSLVSALEF